MTYTKRYPGGFVDYPVEATPVDSQYLNGVESELIALDAGGGGGGSDKNFVFNQASAANPWSVPHNLGKFPAVSVVDSGGNEIVPDVHYVDANNVTLTFAAATSGKAYLN